MCLVYIYFIDKAFFTKSNTNDQMLDVVTWTVDPAIFTIFTREIRWYGLFFAIGFLLGYQIEDKLFKHDIAPAGLCDKIFIYVVIATVIGSRLGHCLFYGWE